MIDEMSILDDNGSLTYNKQKIENSFNDYFSFIHSFIYLFAFC